MRPWRRLLHHLDLRPCRRETQGGHLGLVSQVVCVFRGELMQARQCLYKRWDVFVRRGAGNPKQDNWDNHTVTWST